MSGKWTKFAVALQIVILLALATGAAAATVVSGGAPLGVGPAGVISGVSIPVQSQPLEWTVLSDPAVNTQASAVKAAGAAGVYHVATAYQCTLENASPTGALTINLRDGGTGAGTIKWTSAIGTITSTATSIGLSGLHIVGSAATAMTIEFSVAGGPGTFQSCSMSGYDIN